MGAHCTSGFKAAPSVYSQGLCSPCNAPPVTLCPVTSPWQTPTDRPCSMRSWTCFQDLNTWPGKLCLFMNSLTSPEGMFTCYYCKSKHFFCLCPLESQDIVLLPPDYWHSWTYFQTCACVCVHTCLVLCILSCLMFFYQGAHYFPTQLVGVYHSQRQRLPDCISGNFIAPWGVNRHAEREWVPW